jgi:hypothetical protein
MLPLGDSRQYVYTSDLTALEVYPTLLNPHFWPRRYRILSLTRSMRYNRDYVLSFEALLLCLDSTLLLSLTELQSLSE